MRRLPAWNNAPGAWSATARGKSAAIERMVEAHEGEMSEQIRSPRRDLPISNSRSLKSITAPPTISEVLNEVYQEDR